MPHPNDPAKPAPAACDPVAAGTPCDPNERDETLLRAIEEGVSDEQLAADPDLAEAVAAHRKIESLFELLRQPADLGIPNRQSMPERIGRYIIRRVLGQGTFGTVYLADDPELNRQVAIKAPRTGCFATAADADKFLAEARHAAGLKHPGIVAVHDVGRDADGCYIVHEFIAGRTLEEAIETERLSPPYTARLLADVAEALHYAHQRGFVHRDIKPGNILLDEHDRPHIADFGLAVSEETQGQLAGHVAGTPAYMAPEQVRGETHRLDGRADIWSLGVITYQLLTGQQPFWRGDTRACLDEIEHREPKPPRQIDDSIAAELERITLRCLAKRATDRYTTALDLAEDLRHWQATIASPAPAPATIIPKGLRSFDEHDADFFLELLPGPRDREGLPDSLRFWKTKIEETDADKTFVVGLIYGPSGCGKSSLVKAGLLPRLSDDVIAVYVEATAGETELRLLNGLRKRCPALPDNLGLTQTLAMLRRGQGIPASKKVLIVLDQFEQWLHAKKEEGNTELVQALRQCDGAHLQCVVMIRDDFWMAATRFLRELEVRLVEDHNLAAVDLFSERHAEKVLSCFGRAFGALPGNITEVNKEQKSFLKESVAGLAEEGKVISVRLALFAEMMKGKSWTPASLKEVGGTEGIGVTFLEETFSSSTASPEHRYHQKAARAILKALLPESGTDIKGHMRSYAELLEASGYGSRPRDFDDLIRILDSEIRLITPTDPEGKEATESSSQIQAGGKYYQLTHDYLVHSLRDWLTRKQRETRRGRAELRLAERSVTWNAKPENRHLPSWYDNLSIRLLTDKRKWTEPQRKMMGQAARTHGLRSLIVAALLIAATATGVGIRNAVVREQDRIAAANLESQNQTRAEGLVAGLTNADISQAPAIIKEIDGYRTWADPLLRETFEKAAAGSREKLHAALALLPVDEALIEYVTSQLLVAKPDQFAVIRNSLADRASRIEGQLWTSAGDAQADPAARFRAACALATYARADPRWEQASVWVAGELTKVSSVFLRDWMNALRPVKQQLLPRLETIYRDTGSTETRRLLATDVLADYAADQVATLAELARDATPRQFDSVYPQLARHGPEAVTLLKGMLQRSLSPDWHDAPLDASWPPVNRAVAATVEAADGLLSERFALCQTMPLEAFSTVVEALRTSGYRPLRYRPYAADAELRVAAVWTRDGLEFKLDQGLTAEAIEKREIEMRTGGFVAADLAGYATAGDVPQEHYAAVWVRRTSEDDVVQLFLAQTDLTLQANTLLRSGGYRYTSVQQLLAADGQLQYNFIRRKEPAATAASFGQTLGAFGAQASGGKPLLDVSLSPAPAILSGQQRYTKMLAQAEAALAANPQNPPALGLRALALWGLRRDAEALDEITGVLARYPQDFAAYQYRAITHARLGNREAAAADVAAHGRLVADPSQVACLDAVVAAWSGDPAGLDRLRAALVGHEQESNWLYNSACALAIASVALGEEHAKLKQRCATEAADLLRRAVSAGYTNFEAIQGDLNLEAIRDRDEFRQVLTMGNLDLSLAGVWEKEPTLESSPVLGLDPGAHLAQCRELSEAGYRPVAISVASSSNVEHGKSKLVTASVWRRPLISDASRDALAQGKASAAVALLRLGAAEQVWPLLEHDPDPRVRSFLIHALGPLSSDPQLLVGRIEEEANASVRAGLVLALGEFSLEQITAADRGPLIERLLALYEKDGDAGVHGAAEWLLRQWGAGEQVGVLIKAWSGNEAQRHLHQTTSSLSSGSRPWYVTKRGQTMVVFEAGEFQMGSPASEPGHYSVESPLHSRRLPRRFAIAAKEVTHGEYANFQQTHPETLVPGTLDRGIIEVYVKTEDSPQIAVTWYEAASYCNWLSEQEGLARDQWCYEPNAQGQYAAAMKAKLNIAELSGYRLPSEAEWEYACRAGTLTSRYFGSSEALLGKYAWYNDNYETRTWPVASLKPNQAGLFDMLGNVAEWSHDAFRDYSTGASGAVIDTLDVAPVVDNNHRVLRGGAFGSSLPLARSANRYTEKPAYRGGYNGFRVARTCQ